MPSSCIVKGCKSVQKKNQAIHFYRLPWNDRPLLRKWVERAGYNLNDPSDVERISKESSRVCSLHFKNNVRMGKKDLPRINLLVYEQNILQEAAQSLLELSGATSVYSTVQGPSDSNNNISPTRMGPCPQNPGNNQLNQATTLATVATPEQTVAMVVPAATQYQSETVITYTPDTVVTYSPMPESAVAYTSESVATNGPSNITYEPDAVVMYAPDCES
ncbi:uncharacterized protein LOC128249104 [Octopus bimaculoides]|nr:uncharacterized protein LOC128249104 [Octopus bimaculoides]